MTTELHSNSTQQPTVHHQIVVVGGGSAGITVTAQLLIQDRSLDIAIIEPSDRHYYQPAWTLVGAGCFQFEETVKPEADCIPKGSTWLRDAVAQFEPDANYLITQGGQKVTYDYLIVCPGIQLDWDRIAGLKDAIGRNGVCSNYIPGGATYTKEAIDNFRGGNAVFTFPATPIKCAGAPQKVMYLADDVFRRNGVRAKTQISYCVATPKIFGVPTFVPPLMQVAERKGIDLKVLHNLKAINAAAKKAIFDVTIDGSVKEVTIPYDLIHVAPPMSAPDFIKSSKLAVESPLGWVDVDKYTLQHNRYANVFSLGDASSLPNSKTAAAIRRQAPVLVKNLLALLKKGSLDAKYNGYSCCPLITGYGKTIMAEFDYDGNPYPSFPLDCTQERYSMWFLKRNVLPWVYWNRMLKGADHEGNTIRKITGMDS
ncbi:FAD/NAD(P)-binding oxidoreductase [Tumidithrix elongata RA019]|uniref:FAD/NAD(P)-binding oxidoreductase n=1 Tax=Tumidithrix elongata BACA0141 TaxID=2716417 RepID=A0AAW9PQF0_9CYAN|nr:FAD/NAD(P)-binding oxidoreductase [Tumidithrix elongata RA019]